MGGALSGAATACLLLHRNPRLRVLLIERSEHFQRRVGESTVELSSYFLTRVLGLTEHLNHQHLVKQGLRYWFANDAAQTLGQCSEIGPGYNSRLPGFQVDRAVLDEHVLAQAVAAGAQLRRPAEVRDVQLVPGGAQTVAWSGAAGASGVESARWVVDASGAACLLGRPRGWIRPNREHPTAAVWSRWRGVKSWESPELAARFPAWANRTKTMRTTATNHLLGPGWWAWLIPLRGGDVSIGVVFDERQAGLPAGPNLGERLRAFLLRHPVARELLAGAEWIEGDVHLRRHLAYRTTTFAGDGFALVGDAAGFLDPFYSPGMDWIACTASATAALIDAAQHGRRLAPRLARHNEQFATSYDRWFRAIYRDKYDYMGDYELMRLAFLLDFGLYYLGVVSQPYKRGAVALETPPFAGPRTRLPFRLIAGYNRRLATIARARRRRGVWGRANTGHHHGFTGYEFNAALPFRVLGLLGAWLALELREGWRTWFRAPPATATAPLATPAAAPTRP